MINSIRNISNLFEAEIIEVKTNIRSVTAKYAPWSLTHGGALASVGLLFSKLISEVYISSSRTTNQLRPWGTHPEIDSLWSTNGCKFIHFGVETSRLEKVRYISNYPEVHSSLKVCYENPNEEYNCGRCDKCIRTMVSLEIVGSLEKVTTFPKIDFSSLSNVRLHNIVFHEENLRMLKPENSMYSTYYSMIQKNKSPFFIFKYIVRNIFTRLDHFNRRFSK